MLNVRIRRRAHRRLHPRPGRAHGRHADGDFEADIIKVEPPQGDRMKDHPGYLTWNRNKRLLTLDLATPAGIAKALELIALADVAIFDHAPGKLEALGLTPRRSRKPIRI
uniref:CoA transferase n=1 Tax=Phenylobacterium glaciei TaxID=2803784 RepID=A0A974S9C1_9CAUL|nr:CoA transferase [Phenylobacterium glaciei]